MQNYLEMSVQTSSNYSIYNLYAVVVAALFPKNMWVKRTKVETTIKCCKKNLKVLKFLTKREIQLQCESAYREVILLFLYVIRYTLYGQDKL